MKISGKFILKVAGTLTAISLVVAALLGFVNSITKDKIAAIDAENTRVAMSAVAPEGSEFGDKMELSEAAITAASDNGGSAFTPTIMTVGVNADKAITGISVVSHSETSGIGTKVVGNKPNAAGEPVLDQFIGKSGEPGSLVVGSNITAISGATVSTRGIAAGANAALAVVDALG